MPVRPPDRPGLESLRKQAKDLPVGHRPLERPG